MNGAGDESLRETNTAQYVQTGNLYGVSFQGDWMLALYDKGWAAQDVRAEGLDGVGM